MSEPAPIGGIHQTRSAAGPWRVAIESDDHLRYLAFHGQAAHVRAVFRAMTPAEQSAHADPEILRQVVVGSLARLHALLPGDADEMRREREFVESVIARFVGACRGRGAVPRDLFRSLLDWSSELIEASRLPDAIATCELSVTLGVAAFPDIWPSIQLRRARAQMLLGDLDAAERTLLATCRRLDRVADRNAIPALLDALGALSLQTRRAPLFKRLLVDRLRLFHTNAEERRTVVNLIRTVNRGVLPLLVRRELTTTDKLLWLTHWVLLGAAQHAGVRPVARLLEKCDAGSAYVRQYGRSRPAGTTAAPRAVPATLVTRAMGGIGDVLMMTPGLRALKAMRTRPVVLAIPRRFFPLFAGNDDVELMDIEGDFDPASYTEWFNLTDCPAARIESRTAPAVKINRIELFARALGIRGRRLRQMDRRPRYAVSAGEAVWRDQYYADRGLDGAPVVGVQPRTDEAYRDVPHVREIVKALARDARVLVFGAVPPAGMADPNIIQAEGLTLRQSFALASRCDVLLAPDSAFFHLAGALDLPCVGLFGPTDGRVRGHDYPRARILDARATLSCVPCWRNEVTPCALTGLRPSACLGELPAADIVRAVHEAAASAPSRPRTLH